MFLLYVDKTCAIDVSDSSPENLLRLR